MKNLKVLAPILLAVIILMAGALLFIRTDETLQPVRNVAAPPAIAPVAVTNHDEQVAQPDSLTRQEARAAETSTDVVLAEPFKNVNGLTVDDLTDEELAAEGADLDLRGLPDGFQIVIVHRLRQERGTVHGGRRSGLWERIWNGTKIAEVTWVDDIANGPARVWSLDGVLCKEMNLLDGQFDGQCRFWSPEGQIDLELSGIYKAGKKVANSP